MPPFPRPEQAAIDLALQEVRQGACPNTSFFQLCKQPLPPQHIRQRFESSWSFLHMVVRLGLKEIAQELLEKGASPHMRDNQPGNLMAVAVHLLSERHLQWLSPSERVDVFLDMVTLLARHGTRCDPGTIAQERQRLNDPEFTENFRDPFVGLLLIDTHLHPAHIKRIGQALIDHHASPAWALEHLGSEQSHLNDKHAMRLKVFLQLEAQQTQQTLTQALQDHHARPSRPLNKM